MIEPGKVHIEGWSPGAQADMDQLHATALDELRQATSYALVAFRTEDGLPHVCSVVGVKGDQEDRALLRGALGALLVRLCVAEEQEDAS